MEVGRRRGRRRKKLLDDLKDRIGYSHLKERVLDSTMWSNRFGGGFGPVVRQNTEWMMKLVAAQQISLSLAMSLFHIYCCAFWNLYNSLKFDIICSNVWVWNMESKFFPEPLGMADMIMLGKNNSKWLLSPHFFQRSK